MANKKIKITLIVTVFNEANTIELLLRSIAAQTRRPDEIIITDAESTDDTVKIIKEFGTRSNFSITVISQKGNRSIGRNLAIKHSKYDWIAITDAGCVLDDKWLENLEWCQLKSNADVIAGNQKGLPKNNFQKAVVPYVLVMQDKIHSDSYLPATRSVLLHKRIWEKANGFDETLDLNEDFAFFRIVKNNGAIFAVCKESMIFWIPRDSITSFSKMIYSFAKGDQIAGITRPKVIFLFIRYIIGILLLFYAFTTEQTILYYLLLLGFSIYLFWSINKNKKYVDTGWYYLPILQLTADLAVMLGTLVGKMKRILHY